MLLSAPTTVHCGIFYIATSYQWRIQDLPDVEGRGWGCQLIISYVFLPKTAWKCKNSDRGVPMPTMLSSQFFTTFYGSQYGNMKTVEQGKWVPPDSLPGSVKRDNRLSVVKYPTGKTHPALMNCKQIPSDDSSVARHICVTSQLPVTCCHDFIISLDSPVFLNKKVCESRFI